MNWRERALCAAPGTDPSLWFPRHNDRVTAAKAQAICARCPVRQQCLDFAVDTPPDGGVWAGLTQRQLLKIRAQRGRQVPCQRCGTPFTPQSPQNRTYCGEMCRQAARREGQNASARRLSRIRTAAA